MKCQRCLNPTETFFRVHTDEINMKVCAPCADKARRLGLPVEAVTSVVAAPPPRILDSGMSRGLSRRRIKSRDRAGTL
jgi:hypothetical protein